MLFLQITFLTITVLIVSENVEQIDLKLNWRNIKKKAKNILAENWNKTCAISQVGSKPSSYLDYPGSDIEKLKTNMKLWDLYYKCLEELLKNINKNKIFQANIITAFRSSSLNLECKLCISPENLNHKNVWYYSWLGNPNNLSLINENDYLRISPLDLSLTIINMDESKSGYYQCKLSNIEAGPYFIELIKDNEKIITNINSTKTTTSTNIVLEGLNLKIWYQWTQWSLCSKCEEMGKKTKIGHCMISLKESIFNKTNVRHNLTKNKHGYQEMNLFENLLYAFDIGLPCQSNLLDELYKSNKIFKNKATKVLIKDCKVNCNKNDIYEIKDFQGHVKEKYNNSAGIYSPLQMMPEIPPKVETLMITTFLNEALCITCPGNLNSNAPYEWRTNNHTILSTNEHITVDTLNRLIFKNITENDEKIYTCWQVDYLAGIVEIKIIKNLQISIQEDLYLYGVYLVIGIFIWIGLKMFFDREAANS